MNFTYHIDGDDFIMAGEASSKIKKVLKQLGIPMAIIRRVSIATYEAEMNIVIHAHEGEITLDIEPARILIEISDQGPGIADIDKAMQEGFSTASEAVRSQGFGAGMGLPNIRRSCDEFSISSEVGVGTTLQLTFNLTDKGVA